MDFYILNTDKATEVYIKDIVRAAKEGKISLGKIHLFGKIDLEFKESVIFHSEDGVKFLADYLAEHTQPETPDHLIPSHDAPHVLAKVFIKLFEGAGVHVLMMDFPEKIGTPYETDLKKGLKAISFTTERCVDSCVEPDICPTRKEKLLWDMGRMLRRYSNRHGFTPVFFVCTHFIGSVATIPMKSVMRGWLVIRDLLKKGKSGTFLVATHSRCHGIVALLKTTPH